MNLSQRVVVTGLGVLAPGGNGKEAFWNALLERRSGIGPISLFDASELKSRIAGEVKDFDVHDFVDAKYKPHRMARHTQLGISAALMALDDAHLKNGHLHNLPIPLPVVVGVSTTAFDVVNRGLKLVMQHGPSHSTPFVVTAAPPQAIASELIHILGINAQAITVSTACASGLDAMATAYNMVHSGGTDIAIAGGADCPIMIVPFSNLSAAGLSSTMNDRPEKASRPFDRDRETGVVSEGAGLMVLENLEHALARGAEPYAEILGYGSCLDHDPAVAASGLGQSMQLALSNAGADHSRVDLICAHGPGHPQLDRMETRQIKEVFGKKAYSKAVSSIKGVIGNPLAAAGGLQGVATSLALRHGIIPPTTNHDNPDFECDLDYVPEGPRRSAVRTALINTHGVGGGNTTLVMGAMDAV